MVIKRTIQLLSLTAVLLASCIAEEPDFKISTELGVPVKSIDPQQIPRGVTPIVLNNLEEAKIFVRKQKVLIEEINNTASIGKSKGIDKHTYLVTSCQNSQNGVYHQSVSLSWFTNLNSYTYYSYCGNQFMNVTDINSTMTGLTIGITYTHIGNSANVSPTQISYTINGLIDYYLLV